MAQYKYGSDWRRWEMHLHTPFTKKEDAYFGNTPGEKWDNFYQTINDYIADNADPIKNICAIAVTDYLSIDTYLKVRDDNRIADSVKLLLPNVELRMQPIAKDSPINIHCIFNPEIADEIENRFFAKLRFVLNDSHFSAIKTELIRFGRTYSGNEQMPEEQAHKIGLEQYVLSIDVLSELFKSDPDLKENTIIIVSNKSNDGASGVTAHSDYLAGDVSQLNATRQKIYQLSDMIYSANQSDIDYFLGKRVDDEDTVKRKCGSLMPCVHGCDAHTNASVFEPDNQRYCWIKADPTFEGLKQVLYEPKERVRISATCPDPKQSYHVIDRVEVAGNSEFAPHPINFSERLTCIVGGKSTGKSLLLHNMALAIDEDQVGSKLKDAPTNVKQITGFKVYWRDGICSDEKDKPRKIVYIPQTYLNRLSDEKEETTEIDSIIQSVVLQDENALQLFQTMKEKINAHRQIIAKATVDFLHAASGMKDIANAKKEIGDKDGIDNEIKRLSDQLTQLSQVYNVTDDEIKTYQTATEKIQQIADELRAFNKEKVVIEAIDTVVQKLDFKSKGVSVFADKLTASIDATQKTADAYWQGERDQIIAHITERIAQSEESLRVFREQEEHLKPKMAGNAQIGQISGAIVTERGKLEKLSKLDDGLSEIKKTYESQMSLLINAFETYKSFYMEYVDGVNANFANPTDDLDFHVDCVFRTEHFSLKLLDILNNKSIGRFKAFDLNNISEGQLIPSNVTLLIEAILTNSTETLQLKQSHSEESALRDIFDDWYNVDYVVSMDGDSIEGMSPGKKALVLLRLLISLAESKCPILIDQPEDDLDNRSVFDELIQFIKTKKIDRQIITVTHNANIVLGGDAELVIIANQQGKNSPNEAHRFEYRGGSIENNFPVLDEHGNVKEGILNMKGIQTHICEILEGGERAFDLRKNKYRFIKQ